MTYDGPSVFRAPYGNRAALENFERTVQSGIPAERISEHTDREFANDLVRLWGTKESVEGSWRNVESGDFLIFYRDGYYEYAAEVEGTEKNEALGKAVWPNYEDDPWVCIIYLDEPVELGVDSSMVHDLAGYDIDYPMGFSPLNEMGIGGLRGKYGSVEEFVYGGRSETPVEVSGAPSVELDPGVFDGLYFPDSADHEIIEQIEDALNAGKHLVLTGPPGTGKTEIARQVCRHLSETHDGFYSGHRITTATADWSTFETVGGYMPTESEDDELEFEPGEVLRCFKEGGEQRNDLLVIDEINRSDIDKSFGQLFTLLSGQAVQLPFTADGKQITVVPPGEANGDPSEEEYVMPESWRIFATMNSYDKTSLYEMSYAFMRRFAFVHVAAPDVPDDEVERRDLLDSYAGVWGIDPDEAVIDAVGDVWHAMNGSTDVRKIGPALVEDLLNHVARTPEEELTNAMTRAVGSYVFPQLEGVRERGSVVSELADLETIDGDRLWRLAGEVLQTTPEEG